MDQCSSRHDIPPVVSPPTNQERHALGVGLEGLPLSVLDPWRCGPDLFYQNRPVRDPLATSGARSPMRQRTPGRGCVAKSADALNSARGGFRSLCPTPDEHNCGNHGRHPRRCAAPGPIRSRRRPRGAARQPERPAQPGTFGQCFTERWPRRPVPVELRCSSSTLSVSRQSTTGSVNWPATTFLSRRRAHASRRT
jgi:hypothetical protein